MTTNAPIRVFQVATGNVGTEMIKRIADQPDLELVGLHCYTAEKVGRDAGAAGIADQRRHPATGIRRPILDVTRILNQRNRIERPNQ